MARTQSPPVNQVSKGAASAKYVMFNNVKGVWLFSTAGVPVDGAAGDGATWAAIGSLCVDDVNANLYINAGTKAAPVWKLITRAA